MLKLGRITDLVMIQGYPDELQLAILDVLQILDDSYGASRDMTTEYGGYLILTESKEDFPEIEREINLKITEDGIPEYVDIVRCKSKEVYTVSLFILSSDFGVVVVMPYNITPDNLIYYIE